MGRVKDLRRVKKSQVIESEKKKNLVSKKNKPVHHRERQKMSKRREERQRDVVLGLEVFEHAQHTTQTTPKQTHRNMETDEAKPNPQRAR